ncbi:MAG: metal-dependent transcriptional regulator [Erysipelotrichaceae bacterium]|jgi:DtxR family Mn-dependent transcriptional regulator
MKLQESAENYLETILVLSKKSSFVRSIDIVNALNFSKPSVSVAMKKLSKSGYIKIGKDGAITLTENGLEIAEKVYDRHVFLTNWLVSIGVDENIASEDACKMEHIISQQTIEALKKNYGK